MDRNNNNEGGVKVTYIETRFVTSDAVGFKDLVQRLTGCRAVVEAVAAPAPAPAPRRPTPCRAYTTPSGSRSQRARAAPPCPQQPEEDVVDQLLSDDMSGFSDLFYFGGGSEHRRGPHNGGYNEFPY